MLSKRNFAMMITMMIVVLVLFLSSVVLKEYFNDYDVNHAAETEIIEKKEQTSDEEEKPDAVLTGQEVFYIGTEDNGYYRAMKEWAGYRKKSFQAFSSMDSADKILQKNEKQPAYLLIDGQLLEKHTEKAAKKLSRYVEQGACSLQAAETASLPVPLKIYIVLGQNLLHRCNSRSNQAPLHCQSPRRQPLKLFWSFQDRKAGHFVQFPLLTEYGLLWNSD